MAHSMGNYVLRHGIQEARRHSGLPRLFDQVFLMAADEDDDAFGKEHKLRPLPRLALDPSTFPLPLQRGLPHRPRPRPDIPVSLASTSPLPLRALRPHPKRLAALLASTSPRPSLRVRKRRRLLPESRGSACPHP